MIFAIALIRPILAASYSQIPLAFRAGTICIGIAEINL